MSIKSRLRAFADKRFVRGDYLGLHLTVGFLVSVCALLLFALITEDVVHHEPLTAIDLAFTAWMRSHATPLGDRLAIAVSFIGGPESMTFIAVVVALVLVYRRAWIVLTGWVAAFAGGSVLDWLLKRIIRRPRPVGADRFLHGDSFSFPSGHAMGSLIGFAMLAYVLVMFWPPARRHPVVVMSVAAVLFLLVGWSRLYLGVHYLSDVVAGFAAGTIWVTACIAAIEMARRRQRQATA
jgi:membrane-associated phospholipid phosphatase